MKYVKEIIKKLEDLAENEHLSPSVRKEVHTILKHMHNFYESDQILDHEEERSEPPVGLSPDVYHAFFKHEIRSPLNAIIGYADLLLEEYAETLPDSVLEDIEKIRGSAWYLFDIVTYFLELNKRCAFRTFPASMSGSLSDIVEDMVIRLAPFLEKKHNRLNVEIAQELDIPAVDREFIDLSLFRMINFMNKFYTDRTMTLKIESIEEGGTKKFRMSILLDDVDISKAGGENTQVISGQVNDEFYDGAGMNLVLLENLVQKLEGNLTCLKGDTGPVFFSMTLPIRIRQKKEHEYVSLSFHESMKDDSGGRQEGEGEALVPHRPLALIIDDDPLTRDVLTRILKSEGFSLLHASQGKEGIELALRTRPDLITLDVFMPEKSGWDILHDIKSHPRLAHIPIIMISILDNEEHGIALGADEYITKPILVNKLRSVLQKYRSQMQVRSILVVEDDDNMRSLLRRLLEREGYMVYEAVHGFEALERVRERVPDLIVLDLRLPVMNGFEFLHHIQQHPRWHEIPIVVITAYDLTQEELESLTRHVKRVLQKGSYTRKEFVSLIHRLIQKYGPFQDGKE